ncbi:MAG TPA: Asp-tRNA(Asn)/Glu-tRNA(Gln) amidotransferase subunit GatC [Desulfobacteraceae bacterium]|nr:MAG: Asp-tRNA(Asn)/Glu-tRNA(Gln) amidotransferase subunit GatB [Deltaproteobacteria bacterium]HDL07115.1 Asp-tRNA(Asn)/Glu-tRNA(Gln) amidotransferase subunit GatC [Desulfobacteraceae bacterium]
MKITKDEVFYVADLARLELDEASTEKLSEQIGDILEYIDILSHADTREVKPTSHAIFLTNAFREDSETEESDVDTVLLANAPEKEETHFVVPKIIE